MALEITVKKLSDVSALVTVVGAMSLGTNLKVLDTKLQQLIEDGVTKLVLDVSASPYADSAGLGVLIHSFGLIRARGGSMRLCGVSERIGALLKMTHTEAMLPCDVDLAASMAELG